MLEDAELLNQLRENWLQKESSVKLDYPIFMAVSERGGKDNSGDYLYMTDERGRFIEDESGLPLIDQDLVNYELTKEDLEDAAAIPDDKLCIAEAFVRFAQEQGYDFWRTE
jgi:type I restriction enzyme M protein